MVSFIWILRVRWIDVAHSQFWEVGLDNSRRDVCRGAGDRLYSGEGYERRGNIVEQERKAGEKEEERFEGEGRFYTTFCQK